VAVSNLNITISQEKWETLSVTERLLAKKMGITPTKRKAEGEIPRVAKEPRTVKEVKPYILGVVTDCQLCGETLINLYDMVKDQRGNEVSLVARAYEGPAIIPDRWQVRKSSTCRCCKHNLRYLSKDELISKLLSVAICQRDFKIPSPSSSSPCSKKEPSNAS